MLPPSSVPHLSYDQLRRQAEAFLARYHASKRIPIPIERIVEFELKLDIVPVPGLEEAFEIVGFTSSDLSEITVDEYVYESQANRYRFTLAHEAGHVVLHTELFKQQRFRRVDDWKDFVRTFPEFDLSRLEWQAHSFAGLVLVPGDALERVIREVIRQVKAQGVNHERDFANDLVVDVVATRFEVSTEVIQRRLGYDQLDLKAMWV